MNTDSQDTQIPTAMDNEGQTTVALVGLITPASMMAMAVIFLVLGTAFTFLRFLTRRIRKDCIGWDDWLIIPALVLTIAMCANMLIAVSRQRFGYRLPPRLNSSGLPDFTNGYAPEVAQTNMFEYIQEVLAPLQLMFTKMSLVLFYRRVLTFTKRSAFHWLSSLVLVILGLCGVGLAIAFIFPCGIHFSLWWDGPMSDAATLCAGQPLEGILVVSDIALDLVILIMPIGGILQLHLSSRKKFLILGAFMLGALTIVVACVRLIRYITNLMQTSNEFTSSDEATEISYAMYWTLLEAGLGFVVACIPASEGLATRTKSSQLAQSRATKPLPSPFKTTNGFRESSTHARPSQLRYARDLENAKTASTASTISIDVDKAEPRHIGLVALKSPRSLAFSVASPVLPPPALQSPNTTRPQYAATAASTPHTSHTPHVLQTPQTPHFPQAPRMPFTPTTAHFPSTPRTPHTPYTPYSPFTPHAQHMPVTPFTTQPPLTPHTPLSPYTPITPNAPNMPLTPMSAVSAISVYEDIYEEEEEGLKEEETEDVRLDYF